MSTPSRVFPSSDKGSTSEDNSKEPNVSPSSQSLDLQQSRRSSLRSADRRHDSTRSVGFSTVQTRVFKVIDVDEQPELDGLYARPQALGAVEKKPALDDGDDELDTLFNRHTGWRFFDRISDIETHESSKLFVNELNEESCGEYTRKIHTHMTEQEKEERELDGQEREKKGFKSNVLQPFWRGCKFTLSQVVYVVSPLQKM
jgi:hypothetical protein